MSKSTSFTKRELEKKREKKRQDKQKRKEDRKTKGGDGSLEGMIAYVDENGMITNSPPDPNNRQKIDPENIAVSTPRREKTEETIFRGSVEHFNQEKGYGFIVDVVGSDKYFFHISNASVNISEGDLVSFELEKGHKGLNAIKIKPVE